MDVVVDVSIHMNVPLNDIGWFDGFKPMIQMQSAKCKIQEIFRPCRKINLSVIILHFTKIHKLLEQSDENLRKMILLSFFDVNW